MGKPVKNPYDVKDDKRDANAEDWLDDDKLLLLECWTRDGYTMKDIANRIGVSQNTFLRWKDKHPEIQKAVSKGKELVDYQVENALLKSALGYHTKEVKVTTTMRYGKVVETIKETLDKEIAPSVPAIQMWLYNRSKDKWKHMNGSKSMFDEMEEDSTIEITVTRANKNETTNGDAPSAVDDEDEKEIKLRKRTKEEAEEVEREKEEARKKKKLAEADTVIEDEPEADADLDEWPEDFEDDEDDEGAVE